MLYMCFFGWQSSFGWLFFVGSRGLVGLVVCGMWFWWWGFWGDFFFCLVCGFFDSVVNKRYISQAKSLTQHRRKGGIILRLPV